MNLKAPGKDSLYDDEVLQGLDLGQDLLDKLPPRSTVRSPRPGLTLRPLAITDFDQGYVELLGQLTDVGEISKEKFTETFQKMRSMGDTYYITVIEDVSKGQIIGTGSLIVEQKFIHACALRGRIEDVVVNNDYRGQQLGKVMIAALVQLAKKLKCYKLSLDCQDVKRPFYESLGFTKDPTNSNFMQMRFS